MERLISWIRRFVRELRRRRVIRVAVVYAGTAFVILQLAEILIDPFGLGSWALRLITLLLILGFPLAVGLAWVYNITEEGVVRDIGEQSMESATEASPLTSNGLIVGLLIIAVGLLLYPQVFSSGGPVTGQMSPAGADTARVEDRSIAVLPFEALSPGEESETFARGVHDDLLTRLSNISDLEVISRTSVQQYRDTDLSLPAIADSLGVRWVMEGGVQQAGDRIQVNAQLIDPRSDAHIWANDYRRDLSAENLFAIQGEITREIAEALQAQLTAGEQSRVTGAPTENLDAYRLYVRGRSQLDSRTEEGIRSAVVYFQQALKEDSTFALAWAGLADARGLYGVYAADTLDASVPTQETAARRALELDPDLAEAHAALGYFFLKQQNGPATLRHLKQAVELKPSYAQAQHWLGLEQLYLGRLDKAKEHISKAVELNPQHRAASITLVEVYLAEGQPEKALARLRQNIQHLGAISRDYVYKAVVLFHLGRFEEVREASGKSLVGSDSTDRYSVLARTQLAMIDAEEGNSSQAKRRIEQIEKSLEDMLPRDTLFFGRGLVHAALGDKDAAFAAFQEAEIRGFGATVFRYWYPDVLGPLREDPRYEALIREINRGYGLNPDGSLPEENVPSEASR